MKTNKTYTNLVDLLQRHRIHHFEVAFRLGMSQPTLSSYLSGKRPIPKQVKAKLDRIVSYLEHKPQADPFAGLRLE